MATVEWVEEVAREREEVIKNNPLFKLSLGDLVREMNSLSH